MTFLKRAVIIAAITAGACSRTSQSKQYQLTGQILDVKPETKEVLVKHEDIPGFMPAMTMPYKVEDANLLSGKQPGDLITATLVVGETEAHLSTIAKTGHAPIADATAPAITDSQILKPGEGVPDTRLVDENNAARPLTSLKGHRVALTFMYTSCAAGLLSADGSQLCGAPGRDQEDRGAGGRAPRFGQLRSDARHASGVEGARQGVGGRSCRVALRHRQR
jgi:Cu/Ag efflux protein CusF